MILITWKVMAQKAGVHVRTLKEWHYKIERIPFDKIGTSKQARPRITEEVFDAWLKRIATPSIHH